MNARRLSFAGLPRATYFPLLRASSRPLVPLRRIGVTGSLSQALTFAFMSVGTLASIPSLSAQALIGLQLTDLGTLGGVFTYSRAINNAGQVAGGSEMGPGAASHAFIYSQGLMVDLGTLGGSNSIAYGINNNGQVTGSADTAGNTAHAFLYSGGSTLDLGTLGGDYSAGAAINNSGAVTGFSLTAGGAYHSFLYTGGSLHDLGTLGGNSSFALGINASAQVTGYSYTANENAFRAFLYSAGTMSDLGTLGGDYSVGAGVSDAGMVTGYSRTGAGVNHAFLYSNGIMNDLGAPFAGESYGSGINNSGQVAGYINNGGNLSAFVYSDGTVYDLNTLMDASLCTGTTPGFRELNYACGINDSAQIVGVGTYFTGSQTEMRAFVASTGISSVPDTASTWSLLGASCAALIALRRTKAGSREA